MGLGCPSEQGGVGSGSNWVFFGLSPNERRMGGSGGWIVRCGGPQRCGTVREWLIKCWREEVSEWEGVMRVPSADGGGSP